MNLKMEKRERLSKILIVFFLVFFLWALIQFLSPLALSEDSVKDLSGSAAISDNALVIDEMGFPMNLVYSCGDILCHQKAERAFFINGNQMPFCVRCTGIWVGLAIGLGFMIFYTTELNERIFFLILITIIPLGVDGVGQLIGLWDSINLIRLFTGLLAGFGCGIAIGLIVDEFREIFQESKIFKKYQ